ncbi:MAG: PilZ domain-containing protein [Pseudomonadota bacterium]
MSDPVTAARAARENLARGLSALQSPGVPPQLMSVAEPVAHAMSALHRIEASHGAAVAEAGPAALNAARQALSILQVSAGQHPAVDQALEAIAGSLSLIHQLAQPAPVSPFAGTVGVANNAAPPYPQHAPPVTQPSQAMARPPRPEPAPQVAYAQPAVQAPPAAWPAPPVAAAQFVPPAQAASPAYAQAPAQAAPPAYAQAPAQAAPPVYAPPAAAPAAYAQQPAPSRAPAPPVPAGALRIEAELGAHSTTNFYKGLSGNDVIDSGGIFVTTYQIPEIGQTLSLRVSMPGGYEFEAIGIVRWTRDAPNSGADGAPGFGAQFTQISPEGRQLVYRYVRNREPLFHDDL